jgi:hypothetical protein
LDADPPHLIAQAQFVPSLRRSDKVGEPLADVIKKDVPWIASTHRLPTQKPEVLIEARRKVRIDRSRDLTRTRTHTELIASRDVHIDVKAYLSRHAPPSALSQRGDRCKKNASDFILSGKLVTTASPVRDRVLLARG